MRIVTALVVALGLVAPAWADEKEDLANAAKKLTDSKSYSFKGETLVKAPAIGGGNAAEPKPAKYEGKHEEGVGTLIETEMATIVRVGTKIATCPKQEWRVTEDAPPAGGGGGGGGGRGRGILGQLAQARPPRAPHDEYKDLGGKLSKATKGEAQEKIGEYDCDVYSVEFTSDAARAMAGGGGRMGGGGGGGGGAEITYSAKGKFWVHDGAIVKIETVATVSGSFNGNEFESTTTKTASISDLGTAKVEIPEAAKKAIEKARTE